MSVSMKSTNAPGVIHCAIFKNENASDEIDLELIGSGIDLPLWKDGKRLGELGAVQERDTITDEIVPCRIRPGC